jgi:hypothetical protein
LANTAQAGVTRRARVAIITFALILYTLDRNAYAGLAGPFEIAGTRAFALYAIVVRLNIDTISFDASATQNTRVLVGAGRTIALRRVRIRIGLGVAPLAGVDRVDRPFWKAFTLDEAIPFIIQDAVSIVTRGIHAFRVG